MMNEDAAQKSDSGEKFNGSSQRRKKPKKDFSSCSFCVHYILWHVCVDVPFSLHRQCTGLRKSTEMNGTPKKSKQKVKVLLCPDDALSCVVEN
ncbi:hypothetical protein MG293_007274 [Ovis ammon polii]|uniref:Uncharacterized protein n=1 Tax=Ovis ammon polii TaxID=230172 RepID=A0AAD4YCS8_OVIAM|nr:hypothetical protein MG293_007274 [Ovis ammon polii]